jgi:hypothetical protein
VYQILDEVVAAEVEEAVAEEVVVEVEEDTVEADVVGVLVMQILVVVEEVVLCGVGVGGGHGVGVIMVIQVLMYILVKWIEKFAKWSIAKNFLKILSAILHNDVPFFI